MNRESIQGFALCFRKTRSLSRALSTTLTAVSSRQQHTASPRDSSSSAWRSSNLRPVSECALRKKGLFVVPTAIRLGHTLSSTLYC
ncbi:hypothetical protein PROFUN_11315 [Planoprotostelium fungivorum]|uniref:Uncharacterized protein n=1 Tax=Planoprotostelium fungivorum TaxID=1890364 RepID=A0A2P6N2L0_9EUKA|nr:hypothetical protein PROFUN_11315 [Planoprotostelium fungivorum]